MDAARLCWPELWKKGGHCQDEENQGKLSEAAHEAAVQMVSVCLFFTD